MIITGVFFAFVLPFNIFVLIQTCLITNKIITAIINFQIDKVCFFISSYIVTTNLIQDFNVLIIAEVFMNKENFNVPIALILKLYIAKGTHYIVVHDSNYILRDQLWYII